MVISTEVVDKVERYAAAQKEADTLWEELKDYFDELGMDGVYTESFAVVSKPTGKKQNGDEYCDQRCSGWSDDSFSGTYYYPTGDGRFVAIGYST